MHGLTSKLQLRATLASRLHMPTAGDTKYRHDFPYPGLHITSPTQSVTDNATVVRLLTSCAWEELAADTGSTTPKVFGRGPQQDNTPNLFRGVVLHS